MATTPRQQDKPVTVEQAVTALRDQLHPDVCGDEFLVAAWAFLDGWMAGGGERPAMWREAPRDVQGVH